MGSGSKVAMLLLVLAAAFAGPAAAATTRSWSFSNAENRLAEDGGAEGSDLWFNRDFHPANGTFSSVDVGTVNGVSFGNRTAVQCGNGFPGNSTTASSCPSLNNTLFDATRYVVRVIVRFDAFASYYVSILAGPNDDRHLYFVDNRNRAFANPNSTYAGWYAVDDAPDDPASYVSLRNSTWYDLVYYRAGNEHKLFGDGELWWNYTDVGNNQTSLNFNTSVGLRIFNDDSSVNEEAFVSIAYIQVISGPCESGEPSEDGLCCGGVCPALTTSPAAAPAGLGAAALLLLVLAIAALGAAF